MGRDSDDMRLRHIISAISVEFILVPKNRDVIAVWNDIRGENGIILISPREKKFT